jgi:hypothetical protein
MVPLRARGLHCIGYRGATHYTQVGTIRYQERHLNNHTITIINERFAWTDSHSLALF